MASFYDITVGQQVEFQRVLASAGFTVSDVARIIKQPELVAVMYAAIQKVHGNNTIESVVERVERQLARWRELGVVISDEQWENILKQADIFEPVTDSDQPLVTGGFGYHNPSHLVKRLLGAFTLNNGVSYTEDAELRYTPGFEPTGSLRMVHYDPNAYAGLSPKVAIKKAKQDNLRLAGIEVLEHLMLEPAISNTWDGRRNFFPNLSGLQCKYNTDWSRVPCLFHVYNKRQLMLGASWVYSRDDGQRSSPSVREC